MKRYTDFDEIDRDLKFLSLKSKIDFEQLKLGIKNSKGFMGETLDALKMVGGAAGTLIMGTMLFKLVEKIISGDNKKHH